MELSNTKFKKLEEIKDECIEIEQNHYAVPPQISEISNKEKNKRISWNQFRISQTELVYDGAEEPLKMYGLFLLTLSRHLYIPCNISFNKTHSLPLKLKLSQPTL
jgi:hypothetical protein